jgi:hypothetical protein
MNGPNKIECYITLSWKELLAIWLIGPAPDMTLSITTLSIKALYVTLSIQGLCVTLSMDETQHNDAQHNDVLSLC